MQLSRLPPWMLRLYEHALYPGPHLFFVSAADPSYYESGFALLCTLAALMTRECY